MATYFSDSRDGSYRSLKEIQPSCLPLANKLMVRSYSKPSALIRRDENQTQRGSMARIQVKGLSSDALGYQCLR